MALTEKVVSDAMVRPRQNKGVTAAARPRFACAAVARVSKQSVPNPAADGRGSVALDAFNLNSIK